jgi:hypothetical protein
MGEKEPTLREALRLGLKDLNEACETLITIGREIAVFPPALHLRKQLANSRPRRHPEIKDIVTAEWK